MRSGEISVNTVPKGQPLPEVDAEMMVMSLWSGTSDIVRGVAAARRERKATVAFILMGLNEVF